MTPDSPSYSNHKNPQSWNLYTYALNNPLTFRDADGHTIECANNTAQCQKAAQETNSAVQFTKDEAVGMAKVAYNNLADLDNWFYSGVNALLGTNFHVEEAKPATPGENNAMLGTSVALLLMPGGGEIKALSKEGKISQLTAEAETL